MSRGSWLLTLLMCAGCADERAPLPAPLDGTLPPRPDVASCRFEGQPAGVLPEIALEPLALPAAIIDPVALAPDDAGGVLLLEKSGRIWRLSDPDTGPPEGAVIFDPPAPAEALALDTSALHPGKAFVASLSNGALRIVRLDVADPIDPLSERLVMASTRSTRAAITLTPEGYLVAAFGDATLDAAESVDAQDPATLEGTVVRVDVSALDSSGFTVPDDNPPQSQLGGSGGPSPAWATGVRLPSACTFGAGIPWCADWGGQHSEIHGIPAARDLGWPTFDGSTCQLPQGCALELDRFPQALVERRDDCGIVGTQTYAGTRFPSLNDTLFYADGCAGEIHGMLLASPDERVWRGPLRAVDGALAGMGRDAHGEVFALTRSPAALWRVVAVNEGKAFPERLSDAGCFVDLPALAPAPGVVPYAVNAPLWSDGSIKDRFIELPPGQTIASDVDGGWRFPVGSVIIKAFSYPLDSVPVPVETRVMIKRDHGWEFHSYRWRDDGQDADLLSRRDERLLDLPDGPLVHAFPSRSSCEVCHRVDEVRVIGVRSDQLNRIAHYVDGDNEQLAAMAAIGMFSDAAIDPAALPRMPDPYDAHVPVAERARAYLHTNCAHCHQPGGWVPDVIDLDLRFNTAFGQMRVCEVPTASGQQGVRLVAGDPEGSRLFERMLLRDGSQQMPPIATTLIDPRGIEAVRGWIESLETCD